jgi:hypothetical protein
VGASFAHTVGFEHSSWWHCWGYKINQSTASTGDCMLSQFNSFLSFSLSSSIFSPKYSRHFLFKLKGQRTKENQMMDVNWCVIDQKEEVNGGQRKVNGWI